MSLFGRALAGVGTEAVAIGNKYIDEQLAQERAQAIADIQRTSVAQQRSDADAFNNDPSRLERNRTNAALDITSAGTAKGAVDLQSAVNAASNQPLTDAMVARTAAEAKAKGENTPYDLSPGQTRSVNGTVIDENKRKTPAEVNEMAYTQGLKGNLGSNRKIDHFDQKEIDAIRKPDPALISFPDTSGMGGKMPEVSDLRNFYRKQITGMIQDGNMSPLEMQDAAASTIGAMKDTATSLAVRLNRYAVNADSTFKSQTVNLSPLEKSIYDAARKEDPKAQFTPEMVVKAIIAAHDKYDGASSGTSSVTPAAGGGSAVSPNQSAAETARVTRPSIADKAAVSVAGAADPALGGMTSFQLQSIADSGRMSATKRAAAQAELARRKAAVGSVSTGADLTDPATYGQ